MVCRSGKQLAVHGKNHGKPQQHPKGKPQKQVNSLEQQPDCEDPVVPQLYFHSISIQNLNENNMQAIVDLNVS
jgi:hypothetical protein